MKDFSNFLEERDNQPKVEFKIGEEIFTASGDFTTSLYLSNIFNDKDKEIGFDTIKEALEMLVGKDKTQKILDMKLTLGMIIEIINYISDQLTTLNSEEDKEGIEDNTPSA